ncbi:MAG: Cu(I)-responsive transcriptional regulator [Plesiomonas sp.]|uniref:Cu(I)-responsive transcriptional regulator n=1 Tax=Plesiomonas sp. TaxID=2486279 RepID=UPI003F3CDC65
MNISEVAKLTGLTAKTLRFYEDKGLVIPLRQDNGYRVYSQKNQEELTLLRQARLVGFSLDECAQLLDLFRNPARRSADVKVKTEQKIVELDKQIADLTQMRRILSTLVQECPGDDKAECPIISGLSQLSYPSDVPVVQQVSQLLCCHPIAEQSGELDK